MRFYNLKYLDVINIKKVLSFIFLISILFSVSSQNTLQDCKITLSDNILSFTNSELLIEFQWNEGNIKGHKITNPGTSHSWDLKTNIEAQESLDSSVPLSSDFKVHSVINKEPYPNHLVAEITAEYKDFGIRKSFRLYPGVGALAMDIYVRKSSSNGNNLEYNFDEVISLPGKQWKINSTEFFDITDHNNNLVFKRESLSFLKPLNLRGNVLIATDLISSERLFIIKESPHGESQFLYPGFDFQVKWGEITIKNIGAFYEEVPDDQWIRCYGYVIGTGGDTDLKTLMTMRDYMKSRRTHDNLRDEMILMNTWGDRGQDGKISESFILDELKSGEKLGVTHLQLDDGWQQGLSKNSKTASGALWDKWSVEDWEPHDSRFPSGFEPIIDAASKHNIGIGLWFHPSDADSYSFWKEDADIILNLYNKWGIRIFKIDGMQLHDKNADLNMRKVFDIVTESSKGNVTFNVDATAGRRGGYFYFNEYGNIFLENRYSDWGNYYPHWTLRNLWMLSEFVPPERLQIEFLNNMRNENKYNEEDPLRPSAIPFEYIFAVTMAAQPLAWMESTALTKEAFKIDPLIENYKEVMAEFHQGYIFPIGEIPDGRSWTGFQSISNDNSGYFLIYREKNENGSSIFKTYLPGDKKVILKKIAGYGESFNTITNKNGEIIFKLPKDFSFGLFQYQIAP